MHDARTGFHDIKPLPAFSPLPVLQIALFLLAVLLLGVLVYYYRRRSKMPELLPPAPAAPDAVALFEIRKLGQLRLSRDIVLRELAIRLSFVVRNYLEAAFKFSATDQTPQEVCADLPVHLKKTLPTIPKDRLEEVYAQIGSALRFCETAAFSAGAELYYPLDSDTLGNQLKRSEDLIRLLAFWLRKEGERTTGVIAQSKLAQKPAGKDNVSPPDEAGGV
jgi:hypothetical protein